MAESPRVRKASELDAAEISAELAASNGDVRAAARSLEVSERGLRLRMKQLDLKA
jgi:transcriptional regulator with GAF, ATPase, and Fis domain